MARLGCARRLQVMSLHKRILSWCHWALCGRGRWCEFAHHVTQVLKDSARHGAGAEGSVEERRDAFENKAS